MSSSTLPRFRLLFPIVALLAIGLAACTEPNPLYEPAENPCTSGMLVIEPFNLALPSQVDILMVVDNSPGMLPAQQALSTAMPGFVQALNAIEGLDYHLGVISTDVVSDEVPGELQTGLAGQAGCPGNRQPFVSRSTPGGPTMAACNVVLGDDGDGFEAGFQAVKYALNGPASEVGGANEGFLRADSHLVIILFSDEDDCSEDGGLDRLNATECVWDADELIPVEEFVSPRRVRVVRGGHGGSPVDLVAIVGPDDGIIWERPDPPQPVCSSGNGNAYGGRRYQEAVLAMEDRGGFYSICSRRYQPILERIVEEHVRPRPDWVCPLLHLAQPPVAARLVNAANPDETFTELPQDGSGFLYLGPDDVCQTGTVLVAPDHQGTLGANEELHLYYCTTDPIPGT